MANKLERKILSLGNGILRVAYKGQEICAEIVGYFIKVDTKCDLALYLGKLMKYTLWDFLNSWVNEQFTLRSFKCCKYPSWHLRWSVSVSPHGT